MRETSSTATNGVSRRRKAAKPWRRNEGRRSLKGRNFTVRFRATIAGSVSGSPTAPGTPATRSLRGHPQPGGPLGLPARLELRPPGGAAHGNPGRPLFG